MGWGRGLRRIAKFAYVATLMGSLAYGGILYYRMNLGFWQQLVGLPFRRMAVIAVASALLVIPLDRLDERLGGLGPHWLQWSIFSRNINFVPMDYVLLRVPFLVLLYFNLPVLAWIEEMIFRADMVIHPTSGWPDALWRSAVFGILHVVAGAKLRSALPLALGGLWLSGHFLAAGVQSATLAHTAMNVAGLTAMLIAWVRTGRNPFSA